MGFGADCVFWHGRMCKDCAEWTDPSLSNGPPCIEEHLGGQQYLLNAHGLGRSTG